MQDARDQPVTGNAYSGAIENGEYRDPRFAELDAQIDAEWSACQRRSNLVRKAKRHRPSPRLPAWCARKLPTLRAETATQEAVGCRSQAKGPCQPFPPVPAPAKAQTWTPWPRQRHRGNPAAPAVPAGVSGREAGADLEESLPGSHSGVRHNGPEAAEGRAAAFEGARSQPWQAGSENGFRTQEGASVLLKGMSAWPIVVILPRGGPGLVLWVARQIVASSSCAWRLHPSTRA